MGIDLQGGKPPPSIQRIAVLVGEDSRRIFIPAETAEFFESVKCQLPTSLSPGYSTPQVSLPGFTEEECIFSLRDPCLILHDLNGMNVSFRLRLLERLQFDPPPRFLSQVSHRIHLEGWLVDTFLGPRLLDCCATTSFGPRILLPLSRTPMLFDLLVCEEGGAACLQMMKEDPVTTVEILHALASQIGTLKSPSPRDVILFLRGVTGESSAVDAIASVWEPTEIFRPRELHLRSRAFENEPKTVDDVAFELFGEAEGEGSATTVNNVYSSNDSVSTTTRLKDVAYLGIYAYPTSRMPGHFQCFSVHAAFLYKGVVLDEASYALYEGGVNSFCPVLSGGPHKTGIMVSTRLEDAMEQHVQNLISSGVNLSEVQLSELSVQVYVYSYPLRALTLWLLYEATTQWDFVWITRFSASLHPDIVEWLGTYLTTLWVQMMAVGNPLPVISPTLSCIRSPYRLVSAWFRNSAIAIDPWCGKSIVGEIGAKHLLLRFFPDSIQFIRDAKRWLDGEAVNMLRAAVIKLTHEKAAVVAGMLFDYVSQVAVHENPTTSVKRPIQCTSGAELLSPFDCHAVEDEVNRKKMRIESPWKLFE